MKILARSMLVFCVLIVCSSRLLGYSVVQHTNSLTFGSNLTAGNTAFLCISYAAANTLTAVTGSTNGAYTLAGTSFNNSGNTGQKLEIWYKANVAAGAETLSLTGITGSNVNFWGVVEVSGLGSTPSVDVQATNSVTTAPLSVSISPTAADFIMVLGQRETGSTGTLTNLTLLDQLNNGLDYYHTTSGSGTITLSDSGPTGGINAVAFRASGGGGGGTTWVSNGQDTGGSGAYVAGTQSVQYIHDTFAANGDTITLPTGTFTWASGVTLSKTLSILGSGYTANTVTGGTSPGAPTLATTVNFTKTTGNSWAIGWNFSSTGTHTNRISGIHFTGLTNTATTYCDLAGANSVTGSSNTDAYRVDNCFFDGANVQVVCMRLEGDPAGCVIDHCSFVGGNASEFVHNNGVSDTTIGWTDDVTPGSNKLIYLEDCLFQLFNWTTQTVIGTSGIESFFGSKTCVRYSTFDQCQIDQHGTEGAIGTRWFEFYNDTFVESSAAISANTGISCFAIRGASGFIYNITVNPSNATQNKCYFVIYSDDSYSTSPTAAFVSSTWPGLSPGTGWCPYGPGNGIFVSSKPQVPDDSSPVYIWNVDSKLNIGTQTGQAGVASDIAANRNFYIGSPQQGSSKPTNILLYEAGSGPVSNYSYTAFTYPHPLTGLGSALTVVTNAPSAVGATSAQLNGAITELGPGGNATEVGFNWGLTTSYGNSINQTGSFGATSFSQSLSGLSPSATYHYQAFAISPDGTVNGADQQFSTTAPPVTASQYQFPPAPVHILKE